MITSIIYINLPQLFEVSFLFKTFEIFKKIHNFKYKKKYIIKIYIAKKIRKNNEELKQSYVFI